MVRKIYIGLSIFIILNHNLSAQTTFRLYDKTNSSLDELSLFSLAVDSSQAIWVGSASNVYRYIDGSWTSFYTKFSKDSLTGNVSDIQVSDSGRVWFVLNSRSPDNFHKKLISYNKGNWRIYYGEYDLTYPDKIFIDKEYKPWFTLINWWPHQMGRDNLGTLENDTIKNIYKYPLRPPAGYYGDLVKKQDSIYIVIPSQALLKINSKDFSWILIGLKDWSTIDDISPIHIWKDDNQIIVGGIKLCRYDGNKFTYFDKIDSLLASNNAQVTSFIRENASTFWLGTDKGHLIKCKNESIEIVKYFESNTITELSVDSKKNKWMLIKNKGVGVYNEDGIVSVKNDQNDLPSGFKLFQNYPNPFNPATTIKYTIPKRSAITLKIYDILGRELITLINEEKDSGNYEIKFDGGNLASGIYFYQLWANEFKQSKKMLIIR